MKIKINNYNANEIVKFVRQSGNITQKQLASNLNKSIEWIKKIEQGKNKYYFNDFLKICRLCNVEIILEEENKNYIKKIDQKLDKVYFEDFIKICKICNTDIIIKEKNSD